MFILETLYTSPRAMKALFGLDAKKFDALSKGMEPRKAIVIVDQTRRDRLSVAGQTRRAP